MRSTTKSILTVVSVGLIAASYKFGIESYAAQNAQLSSLGGPVVPTDNGGNLAPQPINSAATDTPTPTPTKTSSTGSNPAATSTPKATAAPKPKATKKSTTGSGSSTATKTGDPIYYEFGTYQVSVTKTSGSITAVDIIQGSYTRVPNGTNAWLVASAVASQGSSFGNISRATFTTMAFKDALDSALAKF